jgi:hypothetical protein
MKRWSSWVLVRCSKLVLPAAAVATVACTVATGGAPEQELDSAEPEIERGRSALAAGATVADAVKGGCSTALVKGLSEQIVAQMNCLIPNALATLPSRPNLSKSDATFAYLQTPARQALVAALDANPGKSMGLNSMFRTVAQQYLLYTWGQQKKCGIGLAAKPGNSNHESGLALDTSQHATWRTALEARGFKWFGSSDKVHFDYVGSGKVNLKGMDVKAFQMLWNLNNPGDKIGVDGAYGPATAARLAKSPASGFAKGASCAADPPPAPNGGESYEQPAEPEQSSGATASCAGACGTSSPVAGSNPNCYCDGQCASMGDCCSDYASVCGGTGSEPPPETPSPTPSPSCQGLCQSDQPVPGSSPACYCDSLCNGNGDCCADFASACNASPSGPSCAGICGSPSAVPGSNPACYCDASCASMGDCCADAALVCGY